MIPSLDHILGAIRAHILVNPDYYSKLDCNKALDERDSHERFKSDWSEAYDTAEADWDQVPSDLRAKVDEVRKESFLIVTEATHQHEIASYVSDDLDLICRCRIVGLQHPMIEHLWRAYERGRFPLPSDYAA